MATFKLTSPAKCTNCERLIAIGETVTAETLDAVNRGAVVCSDCTSQTNETAKKPATPPAVEHPGKETKGKG